jgi:septum site-determining protein MinC
LPKQNVIFKGKADGIDIILNESTDFVKLKRSLKEKTARAKEFFAGADSKIAFKGRELSETEEKQLLDVIFKETTLDVSFLEGKGYTAPPSVPKTQTAVHTAVVHAAHTEHNTAYYRQGLRSGQSIRFSGSVVVLGDVNPGSEIVAYGNVIVLGSVKGMVHAGAGGDDTCFVSSFNMQPTQLRIASVITYIPPHEQAARKNKKEIKPEWAYIKDGQLFIAPL